MKSKIDKLLILLLFCISCNERKSLADYITTRENEYWRWEDNCQQSSSVYFTFDKDGVFNKYLKYLKEGFVLYNKDTDVQEEDRTWSIKNDTIFVWRHQEYKIISYNDNEISLTYNHYKTKDICKIKLIKELK
ncbi:hypothetical protein BWK63_04145 [Flavobacterium covae]|uniref:Lipocalin-like domain-containing protein n=1 Tax=Flavobacterium covae TaxID=2906076 RepID=A0ABW8PLY0_9FLAO|nr:MULTISPECIES: hypothetical protein [Flavobacterium]OWP81731.1 hypothetical protein BWK63_04110 [Flavobacterium covae]OWP81738.1 hypothetical protein BWK63_04145 [Flavobacterium covae]POR21356.1 hypothetical protein BWK57_10280 [Flavobacterium columnare]POR21363.1 hypothetical protein BWK57_10315 [Flavobacterium columnare]